MSEFCGVGDAAEIIGVHRDTLLQWRNEGRGPEYVERDDGQVFYDIESVYAHVPTMDSTTEDFRDFSDHAGEHQGGTLAEGFAMMHGGYDEDRRGHYVDGTAFE